jgi:hypothetical protein
MANTQAQFGFKHIGYLSGGAPDYQFNSQYKIQSSYATAILQGTPMIKSAASQYLIPATGTGNLTAIAGIFYGVDYTPVGGAPTFNQVWPGAASADGKAHIVDAPNALFLVATLLTAMPATAIGQNVGFSTGAGGTTAGAGFSTYVVDQSTLTTGSTAPFQVVNLYSGIGIGNGSDDTTSYNWCVVTFNNQRFRAGQSGVA